MSNFNWNDDDDDFATEAEKPTQVQKPQMLKKSGIRETRLIGFDENKNPIYRTTVRTVTDSLGVKKVGRYSTLYYATNHDEGDDSTTVEKVIYDNQRNETVETSIKTFNDSSLEASWARLQDKLK